MWTWHTEKQQYISHSLYRCTVSCMDLVLRLSCVCVLNLREDAYIAEMIIALKSDCCCVHMQDWICIFSSVYITAPLPSFLPFFSPLFQPLLKFPLPSLPLSTYFGKVNNQITHGQHQCLCHCEGGRLSPQYVGKLNRLSVSSQQATWS